MILMATLALVPLLAKDSDARKAAERSRRGILRRSWRPPTRASREDMLANAHCIVIVPGLKTAAFVVGGKYGKGICVLPKQNRPRLVGPGHGTD